MKAKIISIAAISTMGLLGGCATTSYSGFSKAPLAQVSIAQHPRINGGKVPEEATKEITFLNASCQQQNQGAGPGQSIINGAVPGGISGGAGLAGGYHTAFKSISYATGGVLGSITGFIGGGFSGAQVGAMSDAGSIGDCAKGLWAVDQKNPDASPKKDGIPIFNFTDDKYKGTIVTVVTAGKGWGKSSPPGNTIPDPFLEQ